MKRLMVLFILTFVVFLVGCNQDDEDSEEVKEDAVGEVREDEVVYEEKDGEEFDEVEEAEEIGIEEQEDDLGGMVSVDYLFKEGSEEVKGALQSVVDNIRYTEEKDMDNYLNTIVEERHEEAREEADFLFENYSMSYDIVGVEVLEESEDAVVLKVKQIVSEDGEEGEAPFEVYDMDMSYVLIKEGNEWKLSGVEDP